MSFKKEVSQSGRKDEDSDQERVLDLTSRKAVLGDIRESEGEGGLATCKEGWRAFRTEGKDVMAAPRKKEAQVLIATQGGGRDVRLFMTCRETVTVQGRGDPGTERSQWVCRSTQRQGQGLRA